MGSQRPLQVKQVTVSLPAVEPGLGLGKGSAGDNSSGMRQQKTSGVSRFYEVLTNS